VNLRNVPEAMRPPQETPDPDDDPTREWREGAHAERHTIARSAAPPTPRAASWIVASSGSKPRSVAEALERRPGAEIARSGRRGSTSCACRMPGTSSSRKREVDRAIAGLDQLAFGFPVGPEMVLVELHHDASTAARSG
jgi:hypothetical protein